MNLGQAFDEVQERGFNFDDFTRLTFWLNQAKDTFEDFYQWPWLETATTGTAPLVIADLKQVLYVADTSNDTELLGMLPAEIVVNGIDLNQTGTPQYWWLDGETTVRVWPVNTSAALTVRYVKQSPELAVDTDTPLIPARYHPTWVDLAVIRAYVDTDNFVAAQGLKQVVDADLQQIATRYATRNRQNPGYQVLRAGADDW